MSTKEIRKKLHEYIDGAEDKKVKAIFTMVEDEILVGSHWDDEEFVKEMDRRVADLESGKDKGVTMEEFIAIGRNALKEANQKKRA